MKVLQVHNTYRHFGGEDVVVNLEHNLLQQNNIDITQLLFNNDSINFKNLFYNKESYKELENQIKKNKPDIIHVHNLFYKASPSVLKCANDHNIPVVLTLHNYRLICPNGLLLRNQKPCLDCVNKTFPLDAIKHSCFQNSKLKSLALSSSLAYHNNKETWNKYVDKIVVLTSFAKDMFINSALKINTNKIIIKPNSVDDFEPHPSTIKKDYLYIGRLSNEKGPQVAVKAFNSLPHIKLHIIGNGPLEDELRGEANPNIIFHGVKEKPFVKSKLQECKALIFPSICFEGLPNTILEAYSSGTPIISSNIDNINTFVEDQKTGLHFHTDNPTSLVEKVMEFEAMVTTEYNLNSRRKYLKKYTHEKNILSLLKIYEEAIESHEKSRYPKITT